MNFYLALREIFHMFRSVTFVAIWSIYEFTYLEIPKLVLTLVHIMFHYEFKNEYFSGSTKNVGNGLGIS